jgi:hypothetical protein
MSNPPNTAPADTPANTAAPTTPPATPPVEEHANVLQTILGLIKPEDKTVTPVKPVEKPEDKTAAAKPEDKTPAQPPADPNKSVEQKPTETPSKKVVVKKGARLTEERIEEVVRRTVESTTKAVPPVNKPADAKPQDQSPPIPDDFLPEERDELELAKFIESRDPSRKGLYDKTLKLLNASKKFLEDKTKEDPEYDPTSDPAYKKLLEAHKTGLAPVEKRRFSILREAAILKEEAVNQAKQEFGPEIAKLKKQQLEITETPKIQTRLNSYSKELEDVMPPEVIKAFRDNNRDFNKLREEFPLEYEAVASSIAGAAQVAGEFLRVRSGLTEFSPENPQHVYMFEFVDGLSKRFAEKGGDARVIDGKTFIHPYQWKPELADRHWTFDNDDILEALKHQAAREANQKIEAGNKRLQAIEEARNRRAKAQKGTVTEDPNKANPEEKSVVVNTTPAAGAANPSVEPPKNILTDILGYTRTK